MTKIDYYQIFHKRFSKASFFGLAFLSISDDVVSNKINDKRGNFDFEIVNFTYLEGDVYHSTSNEIYIS